MCHLDTVSGRAWRRCSLDLYGGRIAVKQANTQEWGLKKDAEGFYLRPDGKGRIVPVMWHSPGHENVYGEEIGPLVAEDWRAVGIDGQLKVAVWPDPRNKEMIEVGRAESDPFTGFFAYTQGAHLVDDWYNTGGAEGVDPSTVDYLKDFVTLYKLFDQGRLSGDVHERIAIGKQMIALHVDNVYGIGLVRGSPAGSFIFVNRDLKGVPLQPRAGEVGFLYHSELYFFDTASGNREYPED